MPTKDKLRRFVWIAAAVEIRGTINRRQIMREFGVCRFTASADLEAYRRAYPNRLIYDDRAKVHRRAGP